MESFRYGLTLMRYKLDFHPKALREWHKLGATVKEQFKKKLRERLEQPIVPADKLSGGEHLYKIKLKRSGYRLAYQVKKEEIVVLVLKIGKRDKMYDGLRKFLQQEQS